MDPDTPDPKLCATIVARSPDAVLFADRDGVIRLWNEAATAMFGHAGAEAIGQSLDLIIPPNLRERHWSGYREVMRTGSSRYGRELIVVPAIRRDGSRVSLEVSIALVHDEHGTLAGCAAILRDVTQRRQRDREMQQRLAALEARVAGGGAS